ncbi:MAG TPA: thiosulfate reductase [Gammaproteobacteria bacterium]|nr:thiosulfate reductase [Gammaproteobacteria bacterium]
MVIKSTLKLDLVWLLLLALTLGGAFVGKVAESGFWITFVIAVITAVKGRMVIDYFMELNDASPSIRRVARTFGMMAPVLMVVTYLWGPVLAKMNWLVQ